MNTPGQVDGKQAQQTEKMASKGTSTREMGGRRLLAGAVAAAALTTAQAADVEFVGSGSTSYMDIPSNWAGGVLPGLGDRGVISSSSSILVAGSAPGAFSIGSLWITSGAGVTQLNPRASWASLTGLDGIGIQSDSASNIQAIRNVTLLGDIAIRVTNTAGAVSISPGRSMRRSLPRSMSETTL